jgi:hypothetical protein
MSDQQIDEPRPPDPPEVEARLRLSKPQLIGLPIMALLPILALAGVFGERWKTGEAASERLRVRVEYPTRFRARISKPLTVSVENTSSETLESVEVEFDHSYLGNFSSVSFKPDGRDAYTVSLDGLRPHEPRHIHVELEAENFGRHKGSIIVRTDGHSVSVPIQTTVFP